MITIYMPAYNAEKFVVQAIESVLAQTYKDFEFLIVDDGSTDKTKQIIQRYLGDERLRYIYQEHKNVASAANNAIVAAKGEYIMPVGADDFIAEDYLEKMISFAKKYSDIDYFYPDHYVLIDEQGKLLNEEWHFHDIGSEAIETFLIGYQHNPVPMGGSLKKKALFERVGLYDEELQTSEDYDFLCKNVLEIKFKRVDSASDYIYRRYYLSNANRTPQLKEEIKNRVSKKWYEKRRKDFYRERNRIMRVSARKVAIARFLTPYLKHKPKILDVGCGDGYLTAIMSLFGAVTGFDLDVDFQKKRSPDINFVCDLPDTKFNIITAFDVLEHIPDYSETVSLIAARLCKDGLFIVNLPESQDKKQPFDKLVFIQELLAICTNNNLQLIKYEKYSVSCKEAYNFSVFQKV